MYGEERMQWLVGITVNFSGTHPQVKLTRGFKKFAKFYEIRLGDRVSFTLVAPFLFKVDIRGKFPERRLLPELAPVDEALVVVLEDDSEP